MTRDEKDQNRTDSEKLTPRQARAIPVILGAKNVLEGCKAAKVSKTVFYTWLQQSAFREVYEATRTEIVKAALDGLKTSAEEAVSVLTKLLKARSENVRLRASCAILEHVGKFMELEEFSRRLDRFEEKLQK